MLKSVMNVLMVPVLGFALLIAVSRAEHFPVDPVICTNHGCAKDKNNPGQCAGSCEPPANCSCEVNPVYDKDDPNTGTPCYCKKSLAPDPVDL